MLVNKILKHSQQIIHILSCNIWKHLLKSTVNQQGFFGVAVGECNSHYAHTHTYIKQKLLTNQKSYENMAPPQNQNGFQRWSFRSFKRLPNFGPKHLTDRWESFSDKWVVGRKRPIFRCENDRFWKYTNCQRLSSTRDKRFSCWARKGCNVGKKITNMFHTRGLSYWFHTKLQQIYYCARIRWKKFQENANKNVCL